jgi:hypothetical protein
VPKKRLKKKLEKCNKSSWALIGHVMKNNKNKIKTNTNDSSHKKTKDILWPTQFKRRVKEKEN